MRRQKLFLISFIISILAIFTFPLRAFAAIAFSISNPIINSEDEIEVDATVSGLISSSCSTSGCYLQAEIQSAGGYFGYILNNSGEYVDYFKTPTTTDEIKTKLFNFIPVNGSWSGKLKAKNNSQNQNYYGPGNYLLSFRRFSGNSLSATSTDSNSLPVNLTLVAPTSTPTTSPEITLTPIPTESTFTLKTPSPTTTIPPVKTPTKTPQLTKYPSPTGQNLGVSTTSAVVNDRVSTVAPDTDIGAIKKPPYLPIILVVSGLCFITISIFSIIKGSKKQYTDGYEKEDSQIH